MNGQPLIIYLLDYHPGILALGLLLTFIAVGYFQNKDKN